MDGDSAFYDCEPLNGISEKYSFEGIRLGFPTSSFTFTFGDFKNIVNIPIDRLSMSVVSYDQFGNPGTQGQWITLQTVTPAYLQQQFPGQAVFINHGALNGDIVTINNFRLSSTGNSALDTQYTAAIQSLETSDYQTSNPNNLPNQFAIPFITQGFVSIINGVVVDPRQIGAQVTVIFDSKSVYIDSTFEYY